MITSANLQSSTGSELEEKQEKLAALTNHIDLLEYVPAKKGKSLFFDKRRNLEFNYSFYTLLERFGKNPDFIPCPNTEEKKKINADRYAKIAATVQEKHGVSNVSQLPEVRAKVISSFQRNYGADHPRQTEAGMAAFEESFKHKHGVSNPSHLASVNEKRTETFKKNYESGHPLKDPKVRKQQIETGMSNGTVRSYKGKTIMEHAITLGLHYQTVSQAVAKHGLDIIDELSAVSSIIEGKIRKILDSYGVSYVERKYLSGTRYKPDFVLPEHKLIIECDGLYWHSDAVKENDKYHQEKMISYENEGYAALFFREDEILTKETIVASIIGHKLNRSSRIFARNTKIVEIDQDFFVDNHLMGKGRGVCLGLVTGDNEIVAGISVKWKDKNFSTAEVSRYCSKINCTVVGGMPKLISAIRNRMGFSRLVTFIDRRYGTGNQLPGLGFAKETEHLSFRWTYGGKSLGRMTFPSDSGYDRGYNKIWDCGQAKWVKTF